MTCEVVVMNKRGIALAADSAVTLGDGKKIYQTAEKLFALSPSIPVAIMTFGAAEMMGVPWETVIKIYAKSRGGRTFETLDDYAADFFGFIESASSLFSGECQKSWVGNVVGAFWSAVYQRKLQEKIAAQPNMPADDRVRALFEIIREDHADWVDYPDLEGMDGRFGQQVLDEYADVIDRAEKGVFQTTELTPEVRQQLRETIRLMFQKRWIDPLSLSGIVIAGMGEAEPFPSVLIFHVGTIAAGRLRYFKVDEGRVNHNQDASVIPFGQPQTIDMIFQGIEPSLKEELIERIVDLQEGAHAGGEKQQDKDAREKVGSLVDEISRQHFRPLMQAVAGLSRQDLAKMAYSLVSITAFLLRMNVDESETVSEPVDLAVLSKGEGFVWIKHKEIVGKSASLVL